MSNNLDLSQLTTNQNNKVNTINDANSQLDAAITESLSTALDGADPTVTLTNAQLRRHAQFVFTTGTTPSGTGTINVPNIKRGFFRVRNDSSIPIDVGISGQSETKPRIYPGTQRTLYSGGTNVRVADGGEPLGQPFDLGIFFPDVMSDGQLLARYVFTRTVDFPTNLTGSHAKSVGAAGADADIDVQKNGASIGTISFANTAQVATFVFTATSFAAGDILSLHADATADLSLSDVAFTLKGTRRS